MSIETLPDDPAARAQIAIDTARLLETYNGDYTAFDSEVAEFIAVREKNRDADNYLTGRTVKDVAVKLGTTSTRLSKLVHGQSILDIGCGIGKFASGIAKDKANNVVALDNDANQLAQVPKQDNVTTVEGDGYDLVGSGLAPGSFDSVFVTYATNYWASSRDQVDGAIFEALKVVKPGGSVYMTPIAQDVALTDTERRDILPYPLTSASEAYHKVYGLFTLRAYFTAQKLEADGVADVAYRASSKNKQYPKKILPDGFAISPDSYSAVLTRLR